MRRATSVAARPRTMVTAARSALGAATFIVACAGHDDEKAPVDIYASQYSDAVCAHWEGCCTANGLSFDKGKCGLHAAIYIQGEVNKHAAVGATFNAAQADKCITAAVEATKACKLNEDDPTARRECALVWSGPKKVGDTCKSDMECAATSTESGVCINPGADGVGTCATRKSSAVLKDVCGTTQDGQVPTSVADCVGNGMQCNLFSQTCSPFMKLGEGCGLFNDCENGLFCDASNVCVAGLEAGATCDPSTPKQCKSGACIKDKCGANPVGTPVACTGEMTP